MTVVKPLCSTSQSLEILPGPHSSTTTLTSPNHLQQPAHTHLPTKLVHGWSVWRLRHVRLSWASERLRASTTHPRATTARRTTRGCCWRYGHHPLICGCQECSPLSLLHRKRTRHCTGLLVIGCDVSPPLPTAVATAVVVTVYPQYFHCNIDLFPSPPQHD